MPAPTNLNEATAIDLGTLPTSGATTTSQNVHDAGTTYTVFYKFTAPDDGVVSAFGFGALGGYRPTVFVREEIPGFPGFYQNYMGGISAQNRPVQFPVVSGTQYWLQFVRNSSTISPANLSISVEFMGPFLTGIPANAIVINDDTDGFPAAVISAIDGDDYNVLGFLHPFPAGEGGDVILTSGRILLENLGNGDCYLYDASLNQLATVAFTVQGNRIRAAQGSGVFYAGNAGGGATPAKVQRILNDGTLSTLHTLTQAGMTAFAPSNDESIIYVSGQGGGGNSQIKQWNTGSGSFGSDLVGAVAGYGLTDMLVLTDDTIVAMYQNGSAPRDVFVRLYNASGSTLATYTVATSGSSTSPRLAQALDSPNSFWTWTHGVSTGIDRVKNIRASDGAILSEIDHAQFEGGAYQAPEAATPVSTFGVSFSCPILALAASPVVTPPTPVPDNSTSPCCVNPGPTGGPAGVVPPTPLQPTTMLCTGGGLVPIDSAPPASEIWP